MKIKNLILYFILIITNLSAFNQDYDVTVYTLGYISDYMGRRKYVSGHESDNSVDQIFHESHLNDLYRLDTLLKSCENDFDYYIRESEFDNSFYFFISDKLSDAVNEYYKFKKEGTQSSHGIIYDGKIKRLKTLKLNKRQKISFLAGVFYSSGNIDEKGYFFKFSNSLGKDKITLRLLKRFNCIIIDRFDNRVKGMVIAPYIETVYFKPSKKIKAIFDYEIEMKKKLIEIYGS